MRHWLVTLCLASRTEGKQEASGSPESEKEVRVSKVLAAGGDRRVRRAAFRLGNPLISQRSAHRESKEGGQG